MNIQQRLTALERQTLDQELTSFDDVVKLKKAKYQDDWKATTPP